MSGKIRVGIGSRSYNYHRVSYGLPTPGVEFDKGVYLPWKFLKKGDPRLENTYYFLPGGGFDLYHLWNGVLLNRRPFLTSFESYLPREFGGRRDGGYRRAIDRLQSDDCRRILALSDFGRQFMLDQNKGAVDPSFKDKVDVFYGGVEIEDDVLERRAEVADDGLFRCCFVGHEFFRKGGVGVLRAFDRLAARYPQVRLVVVSRLLAGDYVSHEPPEKAEEARTLLRDRPWVEWHESLPHAEVLAMMRRCKIGILPTLDDTFGWSVLEAMSYGLPVISTDICALPETVIDGYNGFHIPLDQAPNRRWIGYGMDRNAPELRAALDKAYQQIEESLVALIGDLCENPARLKTLGENAVRHVRDRHDPQTQGQKLVQIYREAAR